MHKFMFILLLELLFLITGCSSIVRNSSSYSYSTSSSMTSSISSITSIPKAEYPRLESIKIINLPYRTKYYSNDSLSLEGGIFEACFSDSTCKNLDIKSNAKVIKSIDTSQNGEQDIIIEYSHNGISKTTSYKIIMEVLNDSEAGPTLISTGEKVNLVQKQFLSNNNYTKYDFSDAKLWLKNLNFHSDDLFPTSQYLPKDFNSTKILEWGKYPVLNISLLHKRGITGKGVNIAYIDQHLRVSHDILDEANIIYYDMRNELKQYTPNPNLKYELPSMHGISVASLIVGKGVGAAPDVNLHFFGTPEAMIDQTGHAKAIYKVLEINKNLPQDEKIRIIGFSDNPDPSEKNIEVFKEAVRVANSEGVLVLFADNGRYEINALEDRDNPGNYRSLSHTNTLGFPTTYTTGGRSSDNHYTFWSNAGTSWTTPVEISLMAMALQIYPNIDVFELESIMEKTAYKIDGGLLVNPVSFIDYVDKVAEKNKPYYYAIVYNSDEVDENDTKAIKTIGKLLENEKTMVKYYDAKGCSAQDIWNNLKLDYESNNQELVGVQLIGTNYEVPSFAITDKVDMGTNLGIHMGGTIYTDHFYSNFKNNIYNINRNSSIYSMFSDNSNNAEINLSPEWPIARLLLSKGEVDNYLIKYLDYLSSVNNEKHTLINFSNPIFANSKHNDDYSYFIANILYKSNIVDDYQLYGNMKGIYPVSTPIEGDFTKENLEIENKKGTYNFVINSHGQDNNIDRAYYTSKDSSSEKRESFINSDNINEILSSNYYNWFQWTCWGASKLNNQNMIYEMLSNGKAINVIGASYLLFNNGINVYDNYPNLLGSNPISLFYSTINGIYEENLPWGESFWKAKKTYIESTLSDKICSGEGNYQFNLSNALIAHYFGILNRPNDYSKSNEYLDYFKSTNDSIEISNYNVQNNNDSENSDNTNCIGEISDLTYSTKILHKSLEEEERVIINSFTAQALIDGSVKLTLDITNGTTNRVSIFNYPQANIFEKTVGIAPNENIIFSVILSPTDLESYNIAIMFYKDILNKEKNQTIYLTNQLIGLRYLSRKALELK